MKKTTLISKIARYGFGPVALAAMTSTAHAAGTDPVETGFASIVTTLQTLLGGAGGALLVLVAVIYGVIMMTIGRGMVHLAVAFASAFVIAYGFPMLTGISGATATTAMLF